MNFSGIDLRRAALDSADFRGADFTGANLDSASLRGTRLDSAWLMNATFCNVRVASGTSFTGVRLAQTFFQEDSLTQMFRVARVGVARGELTDHENVLPYRIAGANRDTVTILVTTRRNVPYVMVDTVAGRVWRELRAATVHSVNAFRTDPVKTCEHRPPPSRYHIVYEPT